MNKVKAYWGTIRRHKYLVTIVGFLLLICVLDQNNLVLRIQHHRQIRELEREIAYYTQLRDTSVARLKELDEDRNNLERVAREVYGMHLPGEEIFIIE
jgi:cell division protein FtsB